MTETTQQPQGKGRPTPKRSEAVKARKKPLVQPRGKGASRPDRAERAELRRKMRESLRTGDEKYLPRIHAGPERALVRDVVDARRSFGWLAIPAWLVGIVLTMVPATAAVGSIAFPLVIGMLVADSWGTNRAVKAALAKHYPDGTEDPRRALVRYGIMRNTQFRRQRLPRPRVEKGAEV